MTDKSLKSISKKMSLGLRHRPEVFGLELDKQGWCKVSQLLTAFNAHGVALNASILEEVVQTNDKKRFAFNKDKTLIRASQGHSLKLQLDYPVKTPPPILFHGTATRFLDSIRRQGLIKGSRHHVHLSAELETATQVGARHGKVVVLQVEAGKMQAAGFTFYHSENGVWLTDAVPADYLIF